MSDILELGEMWCKGILLIMKIIIGIPVCLSGWILGYLWSVATRINVKLHPRGGSMWLPIWIQPYWARCMGFKINE